MSAESDVAFMQRALSIARGQLGRVAPNPAVGCVIVKNGAEIAANYTHDGGRPHAEEAALADIGAAAEGADVFVTLEPCGERSNGTRSCAGRLIDAGVARVVIATANPHHHTAGVGLDDLRKAGIKIEMGLCETEASELNAGFFCLLETGRPLVVIGGDRRTCDDVFSQEDGESPADALDRFGRAGMTRVWVRENMPLVRALEGTGVARTVRS